MIDVAAVDSSSDELGTFFYVFDMANEPRLEREVAEIIEILVEKMKFEVI